MMLKQWIRHSQKLVITTVACVLVATAAVTARAQQAPAVLDALPQQAEVVLIFPNLASLNQKLASFNTAMGGIAPWMSDVLTEAKNSSGMHNGINDQGGAAIILNGLIESAQNHDAQPPVLLLIPVSDYKAFVANFNITDVDLTTTTPVTFQGEEAFTRQVGAYAVFGPDKARVDAFASANQGSVLLARAGKHPGQALTRSDVVVIADINALAPKLKPLLEDAMNQAKEELANNPDVAAESPIDPKVIIDFYSQLANSFLESTDVAVAGLDLSDLGVGLSYAAQFKANSSVSQHLLVAKATAATHFKGVANQPYLFAMSQDFSGIEIKSVIDSVVSMVKTAQPEVGDMIDAALPLFYHATGSAAAYYPGQLSLSGGLFNSATVITTDDPAAYAKAFQDYLGKLSQTKIPFNVPAADGSGMQEVILSFFTSYAPKATTVEGVEIDQYEMRYDFPPQVLAQINPQLMMLSGMMSQRGFVAKVNGKVLITTTQDLATLTNAIKAAQSNKGMQENQGITQVRQQLTQDAAFEAYVDLGTIASTALGFAAAMGQDMGIQVPQNMPPIGYSLSLSDNGAASRVFVPLPIITFTKDITLMFAPMFGGMGDEGGNYDDEGGSAPAPPRY